MTRVSISAALALAFAASPALGQEPQQPQQQPAQQEQPQPLPGQEPQPQQPQQPERQQQPEPQAQPEPQQPKQGKAPTGKDDAGKPTHTSAEVMKITKQAMTHITAADAALERKQTEAAKKALRQSEQALERLYDRPPMMAVMNEMDEAIAKASGGSEAVKSLDLAPLAASVREHRVYLDPAVAAGIDDATASAKQGDAPATESALRLARNRVAIDVALLPVEDAYVRVLAAQRALDKGDASRARRVLRGLPIVVSEVQVSTPLVPVRFKLNAAAMAAEEGNWQRSQSLIKEATQELQTVEKQATKEARTQEMTSLVDDVEAMNQKINQGSRPQPRAIRELAERTRDLGAA